MKKIKLLIAMTFIGLASTNFTACSNSDDTPQKQEVVKTEEWEMNAVKASIHGQMMSVPLDDECVEKDRIEFYSNNTNKSFSYEKKNNCKEELTENKVKIEGDKIDFLFQGKELSGTFKKYDKEVRVNIPIQELAKYKELIDDPEFEEMLPMLIAANVEIIVFYDRK